jgi:hypothetical protein
MQSGSFSWYKNRQLSVLYGEDCTGITKPRAGHIAIKAAGTRSADSLPPEQCADTVGQFLMENNKSKTTGRLPIRQSPAITFTSRSETLSEWLVYLAVHIQ